MISLADRLHMTIEEAEEISLSELFEWRAYYTLKRERNGEEL